MSPEVHFHRWAQFRGSCTPLACGVESGDGDGNMAARPGNMAAPPFLRGYPKFDDRHPCSPPGIWYAKFYDGKKEWDRRGTSYDKARKCWVRLNAPDEEKQREVERNRLRHKATVEQRAAATAGAAAAAAAVVAATLRATNVCAAAEAAAAERAAEEEAAAAEAAAAEAAVEAVEAGRCCCEAWRFAAAASAACTRWEPTAEALRWAWTWAPRLPPRLQTRL